VEQHSKLKNNVKKNILLLFQKWDDSIPAYFEKKYVVETHVYEDLRDDKSYIPSIKPYLWWQYLKEDPSREKRKYFYMDSDVIFRKKLDFRRLLVKDEVWYYSDSNRYLKCDYIRICTNG